MTAAPDLVSAPTVLLRQAWQRQRRFQALAAAPVVVSAAALILAATQRLPALTAGLIAAAVLLLLAYGWRRGQQPLADFARQLDRRYPALEDSTGLLLQPGQQLPLLARLQQQRVHHQFTALLMPSAPLLPVAGAYPWLLSAGLWLAAAGLYFQPFAGPEPAAATQATMHFPPPAAGPALVARLTATLVSVQPPAYTGRRPFTPAQLSFACPTGSRVRWTVHSNAPSGVVPVLELSGRHLPFRAVPGRAGAYTLEQPITQPVLYRVRYGKQVSDDYAIEASPDQPPTVVVKTPRPYTLIEFGTRPQVPVRVAVQDDYGLLRARLVATIAQGQGEGVKFREVVQDLTPQLPGKPAKAALTTRLHLPALGITYGDEVYFYLQVWDTHRQLTRSDSYLVQWADTTVEDSGLAVSVGVSTVPAYFRSQRQIIIDTEKLLAEQKQVAAAEFISRSNDIGHDQKLLRLRYGQFMGEEFSEAIGETGKPTDADHPAPPATEAGAAAEALLDPYIHHHDDEETADFLEPAVKAKLSMVLSQMWEAELRLRTGQLRAALPFEYRALRLLKQVQQQTRAYVRKSGVELPPLPEASLRLSGDLTGADPMPRRSAPAGPATQPALRMALAVVRTLRARVTPSATAAATLEKAAPALARAAQRQPGRYLSSLRYLRQTLAAVRAGQEPNPTSLLALERAFASLLPAAAPTPTAPPGPSRLARQYLQELH